MARAEDLGFEGGWTLEQIVGPTPLIAPMELLAYAAACTTRLRLGVAALVTSLHDPLHLAAVVDRRRPAQPRTVRPRRGDPAADCRQFVAFGVEKSTFISSFTEGLELMKAAWSDEPPVTFHGASATSTTCR